MKKRKKAKMNYTRYRSRYIRRKKLNTKRIAICILSICLVITAAVTAGIAGKKKNNNVKEVMATPAYTKNETTDNKEKDTTKKAKTEKTDVTLIAVGDDLVSEKEVTEHMIFQVYMKK